MARCPCRRADILALWERDRQTGYDLPASVDEALGSGFLGCAGGILVGIFGGGLLLILLSLVLAMTASMPVLESRAGPDLRLTLHENFLNQFVQDFVGEEARLDILPGNQLQVVADTSVSAFGVTMPVQVTSRLGVQLTGQVVEVRLIDTQISGIELPPELTDFFRDDLVTLNQELNTALKDVLAGLGMPVTLSGLGTSDRDLWLEARAGS